MKNEVEFLPITRALNILLADDDDGDCMLFKEALAELPVSAKLTTVHDGEELMLLLNEANAPLPDVLFLDLNMPLKNGFVALGEIKRSTDLQDLPVIILSTATEEDKIQKVFRDAAHYYISKPNEFSALKKVIYAALIFIADEDISLPGVENFVLTGETKRIPDEVELATKNSPR